MQIYTVENKDAIGIIRKKEEKVICIQWSGQPEHREDSASQQQSRAVSLFCGSWPVDGDGLGRNA